MHLHIHIQNLEFLNFIISNDIYYFGYILRFNSFVVEMMISTYVYKLIKWNKCSRNPKRQSHNMRIYWLLTTCSSLNWIMLKLLLYTYILVTIIKINKMVVKSLEYTQMNHYKNTKSFMAFITLMLVHQFSSEFYQ